MADRFPATASLLAYPMHGTSKLLREGYRTRDGHTIEWASRLLATPVAVVSRPEPVLLPTGVDASARARQVPNSIAVDSVSWWPPNPLNRRRWWHTSRTALPVLPERLADAPAIVWNPFAATAPAGRSPFDGHRRVLVDLLDDWTVHFAFQPIARLVDEAYRAAFDAADVVTANAEGTVELARRYGRDDVVLLPNGADPERFSSRSDATGPLTVGYVGKIGRRLDLEGIVATATALPEVRFVFAGPILDGEYRAPLEALANVELLGDVHYDDVPALLRRFDLGWVPHRVGEGEVGGDVIKTYEYRAAGLPVITTPVAGASSRGLADVDVAAMGEHAGRIAAHAAAGERVARRVQALPPEIAWRGKVERMLALVGAGGSATPGVAAGR